MAGHIDDLGNGRYRLRYNKDYIPYTKHIEADNYKAAEAELTKFIASILEEKVAKPNKMTFAQFVEKWRHDYGEKNLAPVTYSNYNTHLENRILPALGHIKLQKLSQVHLNEFYANLKEKGMRMDGKAERHLQQIERYKKWIGTIEAKASNYNRSLTEKEGREIERCKKEIELHEAKYEESLYLTDTSIRCHHDVISAILGKAVQWEYLVRNPAEKADPPRPNENEKKYIDGDEEFNQVLEALSKEPIKYQALVLLDIFSGLRKSELMSITWADIDFEKNCVKVTKARRSVKKMGSLDGRTKNKSSLRIVPLPAFVMSVLRKLKDQQDENKEILENKWVNSNKVFIQADGKPMHPETPSHWFPKFLKRNNLKHINFHGLRHTHMSILLDMGFDIGAASERGGYAQKSTFLNIYGHTFKEKHKFIAEALEEKYKNSLDKILDKKQTENSNIGLRRIK
jgi:integrase